MFTKGQTNNNIEKIIHTKENSSLIFNEMYYILNKR